MKNLNSGILAVVALLAPLLFTCNLANTDTEATPSPAITSTPTPAVIATATPRPSPTPVVTASPSPTPVVTTSPSPSPVAEATATPSPSPVPDPTPTPPAAASYIALTPGTSWYSGTVTDVSGAIWYEATVIAGLTYQINWNGSFDGDGNYSLATKVGAYQSNKLSNFFIAAEGYSSGNEKRITIPRGQTKLYIYVSGFSPTSYGTYALRVKPVLGSATVTVQ